MAEPLPETIDEARRRSIERLKANGHVARRPNGHDHAPAAPAADINCWAPVIGQVAADCERQISVLKGQLAELAAKSTKVVATDLSDELIDAVARGTAATIAAAVKPLKKRIAELTNANVRSSQIEDGGTEWICAEPTTNDNGLSCDECGSCGPRMRGGPILLNSVWLSIAKRPEEFLCATCMQQRCRDRLGRELTRSDLRGCDANASWTAIRRARNG